MESIFFNGGPVMYPLLLCSLISLTVIIERSIFWLKEAHRRDQPLVDKILALAEKDDYDAIEPLVRRSKDYMVRMLICGILHRSFSLNSALEMGAEEEIKRMRRYLPVLDTMITLAPLLGIFGTVTGIILSFDILGSAGFQDPRAVTVGISQALITTAVGLAIALFSLLPYNYFLSKTEEAIHKMEKYGTSLEIVYEKNRNQRFHGETSTT
jgi:biopolymer transport protein ExbB